MNQAAAQKLVRHPTRIQIVTLLANGAKMSPNQIANELGQSLGTVAYHVRTLEDLGAIRLADEKRVRGAVEHFYALRKPAKETIKIALEKMVNERAEAEKAMTTL